MSYSSNGGYLMKFGSIIVSLRRYVGEIVANKKQAIIRKKRHKNYIILSAAVKLYPAKFPRHTVSHLNENTGGLTDLVKQLHRSADLHTSIHLLVTPRGIA